MIREINFDMDGTIADLYGVENWLDYLAEKNPYPYMVAKPLVNLSILARMLNKLQRRGYKIKVISWLAKNSNEKFDELVTFAKMQWLKKRMPSVKWDEINIVAYGTPKSNFGQGILFDDEENNRKEWGGIAYDVKNIIEILKEVA